MKIRLKRPFRYQVDARREREIPPGVHDLPDKIAELAIKWGRAERVVEKVAPENKVVEIAENKKKVGKKSVRRRGSRSKSD